ncbi:hypothetical protein BDQ12DRAFT_689636 [Crucibulum laeve]|uniref:Secreted protein n=1 Tax=Crucibulum laeve TaxID=68775 RepID=A0A5C3LQ74_9AGAR|nr:hypothetical protein BDQ12DRAFT_689636 [Crucibulum laeve]
MLVSLFFFLSFSTVPFPFPFASLSVLVPTYSSYAPTITCTSRSPYPPSLCLQCPASVYCSFHLHSNHLLYHVFISHLISSYSSIYSSLSTISALAFGIFGTLKTGIHICHQCCPLRLS